MFIAIVAETGRGRDRVGNVARGNRRGTTPADPDIVWLSGGKKKRWNDWLRWRSDFFLLPIRFAGCLATDDERDRSVTCCQKCRGLIVSGRKNAAITDLQRIKLHR